VAFYEVRFPYDEAVVIEADSYTVDGQSGLHLIKDAAEIAWVRTPDAIRLIPDPAS
jgi:hypothetical protein